MFDISALGELLIDFTPAGISESGNELFQRNPGGAPANVLVEAARLGKSAAFIGMVGEDQFGTYLCNVLKENNIDISGLKFSQCFNTTLAFVHLDRNGDRSFSFYRNPGADMMLKSDDIDYSIIKNSKVFHFGSISMTDEPSRGATLSAVKYARENGCKVSYDPNLRPPLWKNLEDARKNIIEGLKYADILKVSDEELRFITGSDDMGEGTKKLQDLGISLIFVTLGPGGCFYRYRKAFGRVQGFNINAADTTGAGDAFFGGALSRICDMSLDYINSMGIDEMEDIVRFANGAGALTTVKKGAIPAMPALDELNNFLKKSVGGVF